MSISEIAMIYWTYRLERSDISRVTPERREFELEAETRFARYEDRIARLRGVAPTLPAALGKRCLQAIQEALDLRAGARLALYRLRIADDGDAYTRLKDELTAKCRELEATLEQAAKAFLGG